MYAEEEEKYYTIILPQRVFYEAVNPDSSVCELRPQQDMPN